MIMSDGTDAKLQTQRASKARPKGKGYRMGNKLQVTVLFMPDLVDRLDVVARRFGEARTVVINRAVREFLDRLEAR
ncbi:hypothetical protein ACXIT0_06980 [Methylorubrum extorquens]